MRGMSEKQMRDRIKRKVWGVEWLIGMYEECRKTCKSRADMVMLEKLMNRVAKETVRFECSRCGMSVKTKLWRQKESKKNLFWRRDWEGWKGRMQDVRKVGNDRKLC